MDKNAMLLPQLHQQVENLPMFPEEIYNFITPFLKKVIERIPPGHQRDACFLSTLALLSGCMPGVRGVYDQRICHANFFSMILAPFGSGKGPLDEIRLLGNTYDDHLAKTSTDPKTPSRLFASADASTAGIREHLTISDGRGIIFETEAKALANSFKQDWGNFSDNLCKAFHHETISSTRKDEYYNIPSPKMSVVLSGTPGAFRLLFPSPEDGLFSRFAFYNFVATPNWRDVTPIDGIPNLTDYYTNLGKFIAELAVATEVNPSHFTLTKEQWVIFNDIFSAWHDQTALLFGNDSLGIPRRVGLIAFRIAMTLSTIRRFDEGDPKTLRQEFTCHDDDFYIAMDMAKVLHEHAYYLYNQFPDTKATERNHPVYKLLAKLPDKFTRGQALSIVEDMGFHGSSTANYLKRLENEGLTEWLKQGHYRKTVSDDFKTEPGAKRKVVTRN
ncbi:DUF3987 domain-containing protein [Pontibacter sp. JH31]|uniref:DUF3987 domain-containing protein n=1 Tax=Pontibacter aquaedesilientis TaxID=2766980 RepID=A0ABR7XKK7_9BACT|nr:DUF3987 domain-containing protein [Pontibacter aquaedesilientis]MBD1398823.1 DUF3987 domain-containing protein [Pontibacter aquaedesilientis]